MENIRRDKAGTSSGIQNQLAKALGIVPNRITDIIANRHSEAIRRLIEIALSGKSKRQSSRGEN
jgi:plasmid maintenance system antidote protein VapI